MNSQDELRFAEIREGQRSVHRLVNHLDLRIDDLQRRLNAHSTEPPPLSPPQTSRPLRWEESEALVEEPAREEVMPKPAPAAPDRVGAKAPLRREPSPLPPAATVEAAADSDSLELRFGTFWLVRIGIVILLTGFVFLGNFAYQHYVSQLGAGGKLALLYTAGAALTAVGVGLERRGENLRNYARVLTAGGAAAIYYTTYAAHYVAQLRVIESPLLAGGLLLLLAGGMVWFAERRRSEALALLAVLLAYYTSAINAVGSFTLFSSLLLTAAAVFLLVRNSWVRLSWASLVATYASYGFWRFHGVVTEGVTTSFGTGPAFLLGYWLLFTSAIFLAKPEAFSARQRMPFVTANNAAFFALTAQHFAVHRPGAFWMFAVGFGGVLLCLSWLARRRFDEDRALDSACLAQGLSLVTVGLAAKLAGPQLAMTLAAESAVLLTCSRWRHSWIYQIAAALCAAGAAGLAVLQIPHERFLPLGSTVAALLLFDAWWLKRLRGELADLRFSPRAAWFAVLGLGVGTLVFCKEAPSAHEPTLFALTALFGAITLRWTRLPEVALMSQVWLLIALLLGFQQCDGASEFQWWIVLPVCGVALVLEQWWGRQRGLQMGNEPRGALELLSAGIGLAMALRGLHVLLTGDRGMLILPAAALATLLYGLATRAWATALLGQLFALLSVAYFTTGLLGGHPHWAAALTPAAAIWLIGEAIRRAAATRFPQLATLLPLDQIVSVYQAVAGALAIGWVFEYVPTDWQTPAFATLAAGLFLGAAFTRQRKRALAGGAFAALALVLFWMRLPAEPSLWQLAAIILLPASLRVARRAGGGEPLLDRGEHTAITAAALASVWLWVTRWTVLHADVGNLTAAWSLLALLVFAAGLLLRERVYRLGGLAILAVGIGRVFLVDVWQLETIYRILSFLVLGTVLLVLGFVYNRFADYLRRWL